MSVATQHSPFAVGSKRLYESEENEDHLQRLDSSAASHKRYRQRGSPTGTRCGGDSASQLVYVVGHTTVAALRGLFPEMSDKVIADVLSEYGNNIDAAIKHLTDLRLSTASSSANLQQAAAAAAERQQQQPQQQQAAAEAPSSTTNGTATSVLPKSAEEWVEFVVHEMAAAKDMADARLRASEVLQAFEQVVQHSNHQTSAPDADRLRGQLGEAQRENQLLKRAVTIQNARLQELSGKEEEVAQLRRMVEGFQQKVHALEVQNYSLALHLKQATDGKDALQASGFKHNPDVF